MSKVFNDHNVYILGAGFSVEAGMPLVNGFMNKMRESVDWLGPQRRIAEQEAIDKILNFRLSAAGAAYRINVNVDDVEQLFSLAAATTSASVRNAMIDGICATLSYCAAEGRDTRKRASLRLKEGMRAPQSWSLTDGSKTLRQSDGTEIKYWQYDLDCYDLYAAVISGWLFKRTQATKNSVITFNYDLELENALSRISQPFNYGIDFVRFFDKPPIATRSSGLVVSKLHGSINWGIPGKQGETFTVYNSYDSARESSVSRVLIPPTWQKSFEGPVRKVWNNSIGAISTASRIVVVGFSIPQTDAHFRYLLAAGLQENISIKDIVFVNPDTGAIMRSRIKDLFSASARKYGTVRHEAMTADDFFKSEEQLARIGRTLDPKFSS